MHIFLNLESNLDLTFDKWTSYTQPNTFRLLILGLIPYHAPAEVLFLRDEVEILFMRSFAIPDRNNIAVA